MSPTPYQLSQQETSSRAGQKSRISSVLQPTVLGPQTQQLMETYDRPEHFISIPQGGKINKGNGLLQ